MLNTPTATNRAGVIGTFDGPVCTGVSGRERWAGDGALLGLWNTRCLRGLAGGRCLGSGRGRAAGPCRESSEDDEDDSERESTPVLKITQAGVGGVFFWFFFRDKTSDWKQKYRWKFIMKVYFCFFVSYMLGTIQERCI